MSGAAAVREVERVPDLDQVPDVAPRPACHTGCGRLADGVLYRGAAVRRRGRRGMRTVHLRETSRPVCEGCVPPGALQLAPNQWWVRS